MQSYAWKIKGRESNIHYTLDDQVTLCEKPIPKNYVKVSGSKICEKCNKRKDVVEATAKTKSEKIEYFRKVVEETGGIYSFDKLHIGEWKDSAVYKAYNKLSTLGNVCLTGNRITYGKIKANVD